jgi:hypothetical protein
VNHNTVTPIHARVLHPLFLLYHGSMDRRKAARYKFKYQELCIKSIQYYVTLRVYAIVTPYSFLCMHILMLIIQYMHMNHSQLVSSFFYREVSLLYMMFVYCIIP